MSKPKWYHNPDSGEWRAAWPLEDDRGHVVVKFDGQMEPMSVKWWDRADISAVSASWSTKPVAFSKVKKEWGEREADVLAAAAMEKASKMLSGILADPAAIPEGNEGQSSEEVMEAADEIVQSEASPE